MQQYDLHLIHGDTYRRTFVVGDESVNPAVPMDLTGCTAFAQIRWNPMSSVLTNIITTVAPDQVANKGEVSIELNDAEYANLIRFAEETEHGGWDLNLVWPSGDDVTIVGGKVYVTGDYAHG